GAENQLRSVAVGRKNWLFAGSFEGAQRAALLYSLVQSCALIDVSPFDYLKDVLLRVATHPHRLVAQLTPAAWNRTFGQSAAAYPTHSLQPTSRRRAVVNTVSVERLPFEGNRTTGVEISYGGSTRRIHAGREVILSLGAIHRPKVLMQSGIG